jgi:hypothetical protein
MNSNPRDPMASESDLTAAEETLRLIANLPAPEGLEGRVHAAVRVAQRRGRVLAWPRVLRAESGWMRGAAAAAIVFVVAGGGWGVYTRVQPNQPAKVIVMPVRMPTPSGFSGAGAMRTPLTLPGPAAPQPVKTGPAKAAKKPVASRKTTPHSGRSAATSAPMVEPDASR